MEVKSIEEMNANFEVIWSEINRSDEKREKKLRRSQIRYNLHFALRKLGYQINSGCKTIYVPADENEFHDKVLRLHREFGYSIQTSIL